MFSRRVCFWMDRITSCSRGRRDFKHWNELRLGEDTKNRSRGIFGSLWELFPDAIFLLFRCKRRDFIFQVEFFTFSYMNLF